MIRTIHRARFVVPEPDLVLNNAAVHVADPGRISRVEPWQSAPGSLETILVDWGNAVILPGLVNAHTHLELTALGGQIPRAKSFAGWLRQLIQKRGTWSPEQYRASARAGAQSCLAAGTTMVGDISASGISRQALQCEKLRTVLFEETVSLDPARSADRTAAAEARVEPVLGSSNGLLKPGLSPHAPYTVSAALYRNLTRLAQRLSVPLATHVAETREELEFLQSGAGELRDFLESLGAIPAGWSPPHSAPVPYLEGLGVLDVSPLLIHCNYLDQDSMSRILQSRSSVVYCPRSHAYFGHEPHPVRELLDLGINVALGTDSLASNESLSMLDEVRFMFQARKDLKPEEILRMATLNGASALGYGGVLGRLRRGYWADMTVLALPGDLTDRKLIAHVLEGAGEPEATIVCGEMAWRSHSSVPEW